MWFKLKGDERITQRCATEGCGGQPTWRLEAEGVGSFYCSGCQERMTTIEVSEDVPQMGIDQPRHWGVTVRVNGQDIVAIESNHLSGVHDIKPYEEVIRNCAHHLLAFIGDGVAEDVLKRTGA